jgi:hypothetical protein
MTDSNTADDAEHAELLRSTAPVTLGLLTRVVDVVRDSTTKLRNRISELENAPPVYAGEHETGKTYGKGRLATYQGSLWFSNYKTMSTPGDGPAWALISKDAKNEQ